jgi:molybdopterin-guanine dinucleotide biosynthesis protein A
MNEKKNINGIILAGGKASRMQGTEKGLLIHEGKPFIEHLIEILKPLTDEIIIIAKTDSYNHLGLKVYKDLIKEIGPMGGIYSGLIYSSTDKNIVLACDMPDITGSFLNLLSKESGKNDYEAIVPEYQDELQPLCAVYSRSILPAINDCIEKGNFSMKDVIKTCRHKIISVTNPGNDLFRNVNTEKDYKLLTENKNTT